VTEPDDAVVHKRDLFGTLRRRAIEHGGKSFDCAERDTAAAARGFGWLARRLAAREARALGALRGLPQVPRLLGWNGRELQRSWLPGLPLHRAAPPTPAYFRAALTLVRRMHAAGVVHNDLAKEPNWLVGSDGLPALVDFQLAIRPRYRGRLFRMLAWDDLRHLLKHKRTYCCESLTARQRAVLARRSPLAALWARTGKPMYLFVTRRLLGWSDREGAGDRGAR
jgi:RIO-like serine/threonine protein kinase